MRKLASTFDEIWEKAEQRNKAEGGRFYRIFEQKRRYVTYGVYDSVSKKYVLFNTINLVGNFRYDSRFVPPEFNEMNELVNS
jgi:hypothetical protein